MARSNPHERPIDPNVAADLTVHGIDPATVAFLDERTARGNGHFRVALRSHFPTTSSVFWNGSDSQYHGWALKVSGRYVVDQHGETRLFLGPGAALAYASAATGRAQEPPIC